MPKKDGIIEIRVDYNGKMQQFVKKQRDKTQLVDDKSIE